MTTIQQKATIFSIKILNNILITASGGGDKKFGVKNKIITYSLLSNGFSAPCFEYEPGNDIPYYIEVIPDKSIFAIAMGNNIFFYSLDQTGKFREIFKLETIPNTSEELFQTCIAIHQSNLIIGSSTGVLKRYNIEYSSNSIKGILLEKENVSAHLRQINRIILLSDKKIILTASNDGSCRMFEISSLKQMNKVSFRKSLDELSNYYIGDVVYDKRKEDVYTLQSLREGETYITKWSLKMNLAPCETLEVNDTPCNTMTYSESMRIICLTDVIGHLIYVDINRGMKVVKKIAVGKSIIRCGTFYEKKFISGGADCNLVMSKTYRSGIFEFGLLFKLIVIAIFIYRVYSLKNENKI